MIHFRIYRPSENIIYGNCSIFGNNVFVFENTKYGCNFVKSFTKSKKDKVMLGYDVSDGVTLFDGDIIKLNDQSIYEIKIVNGQLQFHMINGPQKQLSPQLNQLNQLKVIDTIYHCTII